MLVKCNHNVVMTTTLTVRDVPDEVRDALAWQARERGQSLQALVLGILKRQADFSHNLDLLVEVEDDLATGGGAGADAPAAAVMVERGRAERDTTVRGSGAAGAGSPS